MTLLKVANFQTSESNLRYALRLIKLYTLRYSGCQKYLFYSFLTNYLMIFSNKLPYSKRCTTLIFKVFQSYFTKRVQIVQIPQIYHLQKPPFLPFDSLSQASQVYKKCLMEQLFIKDCINNVFFESEKVKLLDFLQHR